MGASLSIRSETQKKQDRANDAAQSKMKAITESQMLEFREVHMR
jgi:hypothetical protein